MMAPLVGGADKEQDKNIPEGGKHMPPPYAAFPPAGRYQGQVPPPIHAIIHVIDRGFKQ